MKRFFISGLVVLFAVNLSAGSFYDNPDDMQNFMKNSCQFFCRDAAKEAELQKQNPSWTIEKIWPAKGIQDIYASAIDDKGNIFFLSSNNFDYQIYQIADNGTVDVRWTFPRMREESANMGYLFKIKVENDTVLVTEGRYVWISQQGEKLLYRLSQFPFLIKDIWLQGDRLMLLGQSQLMSCNPRGEDRSMHFSASQAGKTLPLLHSAPRPVFFAGGMGKNPDETILFYGGMKGGLGKYSLDKHQFTEITSLPMAEDQNHVFGVTKNKEIYLYSWTLKSNINSLQMQCAYSVKDDKFTVLGSCVNHSLRAFWGNAPAELGISWNKAHRIAGSIVYDGKYLLYSGEHGKWQRDTTAGCAGIVDLSQYPNGTFLRYPSVNGLYFNKVGKSLWAVEYYQVTKITQKH